jgi:hypothetical protein
MWDKQLHIVCWDIPYPADYGGAIDVFHKLRHLANLGCKITLHCFAYGQRQSVPSELEALCTKVYLYKRESYFKFLFAKDPFIVISRKHPDLLDNLCADDAPILFEGMHSCAWLHHPKLLNRKKYVRVHNIESDYYWHLSKQESNFFKKLYYKKEFERLVNFEESLSAVNGFVYLSDRDKEYFQNKYPDAKHLRCGPFHQNDEVAKMLSNEISQEPYCLYHGNLQVSENDKSAQWLVQNVFSKISHKAIIAGKNPSEVLRKLCANNKVQLIENPDDASLQKLIAEAQINCLYTTQGTGLKLKLLNALFNGGHIICNDLMLTGSGLNDAVSIANEPLEWIAKVNGLMSTEFDTAAYSGRVLALKDKYVNTINADDLIGFLSN